MIRTFTQDDLIRYVYSETSKEENKEIEKALIFDAELASAHKELCGMKKCLDDVKEHPSKKTIERITNYSKSLNLLSNK